MKKITLLVILMGILSVKAQNEKIIENFGKTFQVDNPDLLLEKSIEYKVIFDIFTDKSKEHKVNPLLNTVARYLNMHAEQGILLENMKVVVVLHGGATKNVLTDMAFNEKYKFDNPNSQLIKELKAANVELYVCGQSFIANGFKQEEKSSNVKLALSALTALVEYQRKGYQIINFN